MQYAQQQGITYDYNDSPNSKTKMKQNYKDFIGDLHCNISSNIKKCWAFSKKRRQINNYLPTMSFESARSSNSKDISVMFADFFRSVFKEDNGHEIPAVN